MKVSTKFIKVAGVTVGKQLTLRGKHSDESIEDMMRHALGTVGAWFTYDDDIVNMYVSEHCTINISLRTNLVYAEVYAGNVRTRSHNILNKGYYYTLSDMVIMLCANQGAN